MNQPLETSHNRPERNIQAIDVPLPDNFDPPEDSDHLTEIITIPIELPNGLKLRGEVTLQRQPHGELDRNWAGIEFKAFDLTEKEKQAFSFAAALTRCSGVGKEEYGLRRGGQPRNRWHIYHRYVEPSFRGQGLGELAMKTLEKIMLDMRRKFDLNFSWMQLDTGASSTANLVIDPVWLGQWLDHNFIKPEIDKKLRKRANRTNINLGFIPHPATERTGIRLLAAKHTEEHNSPMPNIRFYKSLDTHFDPNREFYNELEIAADPLFYLK